jgi:signal transduction histidine kinase
VTLVTDPGGIGRHRLTMHTEHARPEVSRHKCLIYDGHPSEQLPVVVPLLRDGLEHHWRCLYLGDPEMVRMVDSALGADGIDTARATGRGALIFSSDRSHLAGGGFDPQLMIDGLRALIERAVHDGYEGLCATGDMRWELGDDQNLDRLLEYEARLEQVFRDMPLRGICQYHRDVLPPQAVNDALLTHRSTYMGAALNQDNLFYIPPELLLESRKGENRGGQVEWMCQQIIRVLNAEQTRDSALKRLEEANRDLERRVAERTAELEAANQHLEAFSYSVSHDLRSPLRAISGFSDALAEECAAALGQEGLQHLERVRGGVRRMGELIDGMLALSRVMKVELRRVPVDLSAIAEEVGHDVRASTPERAAEFVIQMGLRAMGDPALLRAVLTNLFENAWKFTAHCAKARIEFGQRGVEAGRPVFFLRDNGAGFDMQYADKLFGVFQRLHRQEEFPGTGVGLATVQRIVIRHGGRIWAEARRDEGATFFFTLPAPD